MSDKEDQADVGDLTESTEYGDDFEKDVGCLTDEEEKQNLGSKENPEEKEEDFEAQILGAADRSQEGNAEMEENLDYFSEADINVKVIYTNEKYFQSGAEDHESDIERESFIQEFKLESEKEVEEVEDEEMKRYVLEKIEEANKELENQTSVDQNRERKLKFKDEVLQAPPSEHADLAKGDDVSVGMSQLNVSDDTGQTHTSLSKPAGSDEEKADGKDLVVKDDAETQQTDPKSSEPTDSQMKETPPSDSKEHPDSALNGEKHLEEQKTESANIPVKPSTYTLTPKQKELRKQIELKKERLRKEEEERKRELEEMKRRENEIVFRAWLQKKKEQIQEEKRIRRAKRLEELRMKEVHRDPEEAYRLWLKKKHQQYVKERRIEFLRRQTEEVAFIPTAEECDRAFREWLRKKREEKRAAELASKERDRLYRLEARKARQMQNIHYI